MPRHCGFPVNSRSWSTFLDSDEEDAEVVEGGVRKRRPRSTSMTSMPGPLDDGQFGMDDGNVGMKRGMNIMGRWRIGGTYRLRGRVVAPVKIKMQYGS